MTEQTLFPQPSRPFKFLGRKSEYLGISLLNSFLTAITLGFYYPWARAERRRYLFGSIELMGSRLSYTGTGREMLRGYLIGLAVIVGIYAAMIGSVLMIEKEPMLFIAVVVGFYALLIVGIPYLLHGALRYDTSRTQWRGIRFGYRGDRWELVKNYVGGFLLTIATLGIYGAWFDARITNYLLGNMRLGNAQFEARLKGSELFMIYLKGMVLSILTLGIYLFWFQKEVYAYQARRISLSHEGQRLDFDTEMSGLDLLVVTIKSMLAIVFSFGLLAPITTIWFMELQISRLKASGNLDWERIAQTEEDYKNATGDVVIDMMM